MFKKIHLKTLKPAFSFPTKTTFRNDIININKKYDAKVPCHIQDDFRDIVLPYTNGHSNNTPTISILLKNHGDSDYS